MITNPMTLNKDVKKKALENLESIYPDEKTTYEHWEHCLSAYRCGYWAAPSNFDDVLRDCGLDTLASWLPLCNSWTKHGYCNDWIRSASRDFVGPQYAIFTELIMECSQISEDDRLYNARQCVTKSENPTVDTFTMKAHDVSEDTLRGWLDKSDPGNSHPYHTTADDHADDVVRILAERHQSNLSSYWKCAEIMELFEIGYADGIRDCAQNWKNAHVTDTVLDELKQLNNLLREGIPASSLRHVVLPDVPEDVRSFFTLILDAAEIRQKKQETEENA